MMTWLTVPTVRGCCCRTVVDVNITVTLRCYYLANEKQSERKVKALIMLTEIYFIRNSLHSIDNRIYIIYVCI